MHRPDPARPFLSGLKHNAVPADQTQRPAPSGPSSCHMPGFLGCSGASTAVVVMAWGWALFIKTLLILLALRPASVPRAGGKAGQPGRLSTGAPQSSETRGHSCSSSRAMVSMSAPPSSSPSPCSSMWSRGRGSGGRSRAGSWKERRTSGVRKAPCFRPAPLASQTLVSQAPPPPPPPSWRLPAPASLGFSAPRPPLTMSTRAT